jgi:hypothetical protein
MGYYSFYCYRLDYTSNRFVTKLKYYERYIQLLFRNSCMALCHYETNYDSHIFCAVLQNQSPVGDSFNRPYIIRNKGYFVDCIYMVLICCYEEDINYN